MDFVSVIFFLFLYYVRPQEWIQALHGMPIVQYLMIFGLSAMLVRHKGLRMGDFFKTPHDWVMLAYFAWVVGTSPQTRTTFEDMRNLSLFYVLIVQAIGDRKQLKKFVVVWTWMIFAVAALAVASEFGFDPTNSYQLTHNLRMRGRLCLNTSIFWNPNDLAHGVISVIPMLYFIYIWNRPVFVKELGVLTMVVPVYCVYLTKSRGGYMAGVASFGSSLLFGRPRIVQFLLLAVILVVGPPVISKFRHLERPEDPGAEAGVEGRNLAFRFGLATMRDFTKGLGYRQFRKYSPWRIEIEKGKKVKTTRLAAHSAYVAAGAELGYTGLFLWLGVLYCCIRTLTISRCEDVEDERLRRLLLTAVIAYMFSGWFSDLTYRAVYFIIAAACASFHRVVRLNPIVASDQKDLPSQQTARNTLPQSSTSPQTRPAWNRIGLLDIVFMFALMWAVILTWQFMIRHM